MPSAVRRSKRTAGKTIPAPTKYKFDLYKDPEPVIGRKKKAQVVVPKKGNKDPLLDTDEEEGEPTRLKTHPSKNYTKMDLYDRWVEARTQKVEYRNQISELQKEILKDKKEVEKLYRDLNKEKNLVEELEAKVKDLTDELDECKEKKESNKGVEKKTVSDSERIQNMRATFKNLTEKKGV